MIKKKVAIQGFEGSFHQFAAQQYFKNPIQAVYCASFRELIAKAQNPNIAHAAVMAIENSIAGSILPNYSLLKNSHLQVTGEIYLQIKQQLIVNKGVKIQDIQEIHSHPIAILQCWDFLEQHQWKIVETEDTALSVKKIHDTKAKNIAGIAGKIAAQIFDMTILVKDINSMKENYTRFLVLEPKTSKNTIDPHANKASISFELENRHGSLAQVLARIHYYGINLTKLQSFPVPGSKWNYYFHSDMEFQKINTFYQTLDDIKNVTKNIQIYGVYKKGITI